MDKTLEELKAEASVLGIEYSTNIGAKKLSEKIEEYYTSQAAGDFVQVKEEVKDEKPVKGQAKSESDHILEAKASAMKTKIVTVINNDTRENTVLEADYFGFENQFFAKSYYVPFNIPVELPVCVIDVIKMTKIQVFQEEFVGGSRTGNKVGRMINKYSVSFEEVK